MLRQNLISVSFQTAFAENPYTSGTCSTGGHLSFSTLIDVMELIELQIESRHFVLFCLVWFYYSQGHKCVDRFSSISAQSSQLCTHQCSFHDSCSIAHNISGQKAFVALNINIVRARTSSCSSIPRWREKKAPWIPPVWPFATNFSF